MRLRTLVAPLLLLAAACAAGSDDPGADGGSSGTGGVAGDGGAGQGGTGHAGSGGAGTGGVGPGGAGGSLPDPNTTPFPSTCSPRPPPRVLAWNRTTQTQVWSWDTWAVVLENRPLAPGESSALLPDANHLVVLDSASSTVELLLVIDHEALRPVLGTGVTVAISYEDRDETWPTFVAFSYGDRLVWQYGLYAYADGWRGLTMTPDRALCLEDGPCPTYGRSVKVRWRDGPEEVVLPGDLVHLESSEDGLWFQLDGMFQPTGEGCTLPWTTQGGWVAAMDPDFRSAPACTVGDDAPCGEGARCEPSEPQRCATGVPGRCAPAPITCGPAEAKLCGCDGLVHDTGCGVDVAQDTSGCAAPAGHFACGASFCRLGVERCEHVPAGLGEPERRWCRPVTGPCAAGPSGCACAAAEPCALGCTEQEPGAIALECVAPGAPVNGRDPLCDAWVETLSASPEVDGVTTLAVFEHGLVRAASTERHVLASEPLRLYDVATGRDRPLNLLQGGAPLEVALSDERAVFHAIRRYGSTELSSVVVLDLASCEARELLLQPATEPGGRRYGISVDGDRAVFASSREPTADSTITLLDLRTGEEQQLTGQEGSAGGAQLVGDVVVFESAPDFDLRLELLRLSTGERRVIGPGYTAFHTDGRSVVWSDDNLAGGRSEIWLYDIEGGTARRLDASTEGELARPLVAGDHVVWEEQVGIGSRIHHESIASGVRTRLYESERSTFLHAIVGSTARLSASDGPVRDRLISVPLP